MEQTITQILKNVDKNLLSILATSLIAFICWVVKGLIEVPLVNSKEIFFKYFDKRIEVLGDIKIRLSIIAYFPGEEGKTYKEQLQDLLLKDGKSAYLDSDIFSQTLDISINPNTEEEKLINAITIVNRALAAHIGKVEQSNNFYSKYANVNPIRRITSYLLLSLYYVLIIILLFLLMGVSVYFILYGTICIKIITGTILLSLLLILNNWLNKTNGS